MAYERIDCLSRFIDVFRVWSLNAGGRCYATLCGGTGDDKSFHRSGDGTRRARLELSRFAWVVIWSQNWYLVFGERSHVSPPLTGSKGTLPAHEVAFGKRYSVSCQLILEGPCFLR